MRDILKILICMAMLADSICAEDQFNWDERINQYAMGNRELIWELTLKSQEYYKTIRLQKPPNMADGDEKEFAKIAVKYSGEMSLLLEKINYIIAAMGDSEGPNDVEFMKWQRGLLREFGDIDYNYADFNYQYKRNFCIWLKLNKFKQKD